jgi:hypothetical protein
MSEKRTGELNKINNVFGHATHILFLEKGISIGALLGNLGGGSSTEDFERWMKGAPGMKHLSLKSLSAKGLWGGFLQRRPQKIY